MFICPECKSKMNLPQCLCGYNVTQINNVWQLTDAPDMVTGGNGDKYIGYEHIGESYSGDRRCIIEASDALFAKEVSKLTGDGIFLDLGCGTAALPCLVPPTEQESLQVIFPTAC